MNGSIGLGQWGMSLGLGGLGGGASILSGIGASRRMTRERRRTRELIAWTGYAAKKKAQEILASEEWQLPAQFYKGMFEEGAPSWMQQAAASSLRQAQEARGMAYGGAPALAESEMLTRLVYQGKMQAAPILQQMALAPLQIEQAAFQHYLGMTGLQFGVTQLGPSPLEIAGQGLASFVSTTLAAQQAQMGYQAYQQMFGQQQRGSLDYGQAPMGTGAGYNLTSMPFGGMGMMPNQPLMTSAKLW